MSQSDRLLTAREVGETLALHPETVLHWVRDGKLPAFRLPGGAIRIRQTELEEWLDQRATARPPTLHDGSARGTICLMNSFDTKTPTWTWPEWRQAKAGTRFRHNQSGATGTFVKPSRVRNNGAVVRWDGTDRDTCVVSPARDLSPIGDG